MLDAFDACIGLSRGVEKFATMRHQPFLWMPGGCSPARAPKFESTAVENGPIRFCYFGALAAHAGVLEMVEAFLQTSGDSELHICGYGKLTGELKAMSQRSPAIEISWLAADAGGLSATRAIVRRARQRPPAWPWQRK